jgi:hypothetical protein
VEAGTVSHYRIIDENPNNQHQWKHSLLARAKTFEYPPKQSIVDLDLYSEPNEKIAQHLGIQHIILPKRSYNLANEKSLKTRIGLLRAKVAPCEYNTYFYKLMQFSDTILYPSFMKYVTILFVTSNLRLRPIFRMYGAILDNFSPTNTLAV